MKIYRFFVKDSTVKRMIAKTRKKSFVNTTAPSAFIFLAVKYPVMILEYKAELCSASQKNLQQQFF
jgi:hypothetical protein